MNSRLINTAKRAEGQEDPKRLILQGEMQAHIGMTRCARGKKLRMPLWEYRTKFNRWRAMPGDLQGWLFSARDR